MGRFAEFLLAFRWLMIAVVFAALGAAAWVMPEIEFSLSITPLIEGQEEAKQRTDSLEAELPPQKYHLVAVVTWPKAIGHAELAALDRLHDAIAADEKVRSIVSLAKIPILQPGALLPRPFAKTVGDRNVVEAAQSHPLLHRRLISADGRSTSMFIMGTKTTADTADLAAGVDPKDAMLDWLAEFVPKELGGGATLTIVSGYVAERARKVYMQEDLTLLIGMELLMAIVVLSFVFRSVRGIVLPLAAVTSAVLLNFGLLHFTGSRLGIIELAIPGLIILIGLSDAVHLLHRFEEALTAGLEKRAGIVHMCKDVGVACFITSLTTAVGFLSLLIADHAPVREFGIKAAVAVLVTFVVTVTIIPLGLSLCRARRAALPRLPAMHRIKYGKGRLVTTCFIAVMGLAAWGISNVVVQARWLEELPEHDPIKAHVAFLEDQFAGALEIDAEVVGDLSSPAAIRALEKFQDAIMKTPGVLWCESITHWMRAVNGNPKGDLSDNQIAKGHLVIRGLGKLFPRHVVREDFKKGRVIFRTKNLASSGYLAIRDRIESLAADPALDLEIHPTGYGLMAHESGVLVSETLLESLALSVVAITILISFIFRSLRLGLISMLPNLAPIVIALGLNGWLGIPLRVGIVMIYSLGLGLAVDDTIHLLTRYVQERKRDPGASTRSALLTSLRTSGAALVVTSIILVAGSLCFLPANFQSIHDVGILLSAIVVTALIADLFVLPLMIERFGGR